MIKMEDVLLDTIELQKERVENSPLGIFLNEEQEFMSLKLTKLTELTFEDFIS